MITYSQMPALLTLLIIAVTLTENRKAHGATQWILQSAGSIVMSACVVLVRLTFHPLSAMVDFRLHIIVHFTYLAVKG